MADKVFVISGTVDQFTSWRSQNIDRLVNAYGITKLADIVYVSSVDILRGYSEPHGMFIGTWYHRNDIGAILIQLTIAGSIDHDKCHDLALIVEKNK